MRFVYIKDVVPGMIIGETIAGSNRDVLLKEGMELTSSHISQLNYRGVKGLYIKDCHSENLYVEDIINPDSMETAIDTFEHSIKELLDDKYIYNFNKEINKSIIKTVKQTINKLISDEYMIANMIKIKSMDEEIFNHSVNVTVSSLMIGVAFNMKSKELYQLGMAALLHDMPKAALSDNLRKKEKITNLSLNDRKFARNLIKKGYEIIDKQNLPIKTKRAIYEHSQRIYVDDVSISKAKQKISIYAEIIGLCDMYDDLVSDKYNGNMLPSDAIEHIMGYSNILFDIEIVRAFIHHIAIYPVGTVVRLSTGQLGIVIRNFAGFASRPIVKLVITEEKINLMDKTNLCITITSYYKKSEIDKLNQ